mgnify:CR=1 FL=1
MGQGARQVGEVPYGAADAHTLKQAASSLQWQSRSAWLVECRSWSVGCVCLCVAARVCASA